MGKSAPARPAGQLYASVPIETIRDPGKRYQSKHGDKLNIKKHAKNTDTRTQPNPRGQEPRATRSPTPRARAVAADQIRHPPEAANTAAARMLPDGGGDDEERWLAEGIAGVQQNAFYMHRALVSPAPPLPLPRNPSPPGR